MLVCCICFLKLDLIKIFKRIDPRMFFAQSRRLSILIFLTVTRDKIGEIEIQFPDGNVDVIRIDAKSWLRAFRSFLKPFAVCRFQWNCLEKDHHNQVQPPYLSQRCRTEIVTIRVCVRTREKNSPLKISMFHFFLINKFV